MEIDLKYENDVDDNLIYHFVATLVRVPWKILGLIQLSLKEFKEN